MDDQFTDRLSDYLDDELDARERASVDAHLATCAECRRVLDDLRRVVATAQALPPRPPASELWPAIAERLSWHRTTVPWRWTDAWRGPSVRHLTVTLPQAAAAALVLSLLSGGMVWWLSSAPATPSGAHLQVRPADLQLRPGGEAGEGRFEEPVVSSPVSLGDAQYDAAVGDLQRALAQGRGRLDPATVAAIEQSLDAIDSAIAQARQALDRDPANSYLSGHLIETRRRKLDLLRRAAALTAEMD